MLEQPIDRDIPQALADISPDVIYFLDNEFRIEYCNPAWDQFALRNGGERAVRAVVLGANLFEVVPESLRDFYRQVFADCFARQHAVAFDYECSSPVVHRTFRMQILPRREGGFVVVNSLRVVGPPDGLIHDPGPRYEGAEGIVTVCAHCRRTRSVDELQSWDWVPQYLADSRQRVSHGLCPLCLAYYYQLLPSQLRDPAVMAGR